MMYNILEQTTEKQGEIMSINTDHQLREQMSHDNAVFPITFFHDELASLPNYEGLLHWHPEFEIATAQSATLDFQIGQEHITLQEITADSEIMSEINTEENPMKVSIEFEAAGLAKSSLDVSESGYSTQTFRRD